MAVDPLVGVLGDEEVVGPSADQRAQELPVGRAEVLALVDQDVVEAARLARPRRATSAAIAAASAKSTLPWMPAFSR